MKLRNKSITDSQKILEKAGETFAIVVHKEQSKCKHEDIAECSSGGEFITMPPIRICLECGLTEEGWGCGFSVLKENSGLTPHGISRDRLYSLRVGEFITQ